MTIIAISVYLLQNDDAYISHTLGLAAGRPTEGRPAIGRLQNFLRTPQERYGFGVFRRYRDGIESWSVLQPPKTVAGHGANNF
jgi:hypothetical protein